MNTKELPKDCQVCGRYLSGGEQLEGMCSSCKTKLTQCATCHKQLSALEKNKGLCSSCQSKTS